MGYGLMGYNERRRPSAKAIEEENSFMRLRQEHFRIAAERVAAAFADVHGVQRVVLFGSVAAPLREEVPHYGRFRMHGVSVLHECKDVDLAAWVSNLSCLRALQKARGQALNCLYAEKQIGVAHHQVDVFIIDAGTGKYVGNLCSFGACPKGKNDCYVQGCGETPYLKLYENFALHEDALSPMKTTVLFQRCEEGAADIVA